MSWSDPQQIVVSKPTFSIVGGTATIGTTSYRVPAGGFSVSVPSTWAGVDRKAAGVALKTQARSRRLPRPEAEEPRVGRLVAAVRRVRRRPARRSRPPSSCRPLPTGSDTHSAWVTERDRAGEVARQLGAVRPGLAAGGPERPVHVHRQGAGSHGDGRRVLPPASRRHLLAHVHQLARRRAREGFRLRQGRAVVPLHELAGRVDRLGAWPRTSTWLSRSRTRPTSSRSRAFARPTSASRRSPT